MIVIITREAMKLIPAILSRKIHVQSPRPSKSSLNTLDSRGSDLRFEF